ncbi:MAG: SURF1 family protein [Pseudomonadota bacterium]
MSRVIFFLILGFSGLAVLIYLGIWQMQRLEWKTNLLAEIDLRMAQDPVAIPKNPTKAKDNFRRVEFEGTLLGIEAHVLTSERNTGPGYKIVAGAAAPGTRILIDLGFVPLEAKDATRFGAVKVVGNLYWPNETDPKFTPNPDFDENIFFARNLFQMASFVDTQQILVVATEIEQDFETIPQRVAHNLPNNHLEYAITWFGLAAVWAAMTGYALVKTRRTA